MSPLFTVVIPAFNAESTLIPAVESVLAQTEPDLEVVIVDDGSTDGTRRLADGIADPRARVLTQPNAGLPAARNAGAAAARGEFVCFLDSDDVLLPRYLEVVRERFAEDTGVDFVYTDAWTFDDRTRRVRWQTTAHYQRPPRPVPASAAALFRELVDRNFIIVPVTVRREVLAAAGGFDEAMTSVEDWDMWLRLTAAGHRGAEARGPLGLRREHASQMTGNYARMAANQVHALEKLLREHDLGPADADRVRARLAHVRREHRILSGADRRGAMMRRLKWRLGAARRAVGLGARWYAEPPPAVADAFGDLSVLGEQGRPYAPARAERERAPGAAAGRERAPAGRVAYVLITHRATAQVRRLVDRLLRSDPRGIVVISHDAARGPLPLGECAQDPRVHVRTAPRPRRWGSYALADDLLETIFWTTANTDAQWLAVLSGQDYPIRPLARYADELAASGFDAFVAAEPVPATRPGPGDSGALYTHVRYFFRWFELPGWVLGWIRGDRAVAGLRAAQRRLSFAQPLVFLWSLPAGGGDMVGLRRRRVPFGPGFDCFKGSQWLTLSRHAARSIERLVAIRPDVVRTYRGSLIADESLPVTILCNDPGLRVARDNHHFIRMTGGGEAHAAVLTLSDLQALRASGRWFARKFDEAVDSAVLDRLDGVVLADAADAAGAPG